MKCRMLVVVAALWALSYGVARSQPPETLTGEIEEAMEMFGGHGPKHLHFLVLPDGERLEIADLPHGLKLKKHVTLKGKRYGQGKFAPDNFADLAEGAALDPIAQDNRPENLGALRAIAIFVEFSDVLANNFTVDQLRATIKAEAEPFYTEISHGRTSITFDVVGKFNLGVPHQCGLAQLIQQAINAADAQGVDFRPYSFVTIFSPTSCGYGGVARLGRGSITTPDGVITAGYSNNVTQRGLRTGVYISRHEVGHNLGSHHSGFLLCPNGTDWTSNGCNKIEYGNSFSTMGASGIGGWYDPMQLHFIGFLSDSDIATPTTPGRYTLLTEESTAAGLKGIRIQRGANNWLWIGQRSPIGWDKNFLATHAGTDIYNGPNLTITDPDGGSFAGGKTMMLDATPDLVPTIDSVKTATMQVGQTFHDVVTGADVTFVSKTGDEVTLDISPGTPDLQNPIIKFLAPTYISSPTGGLIIPSVSGMLHVSLTASDNALQAVELWSSGARVLLEKTWTACPCEFDIDTRRFLNKIQELSAVARDKVGNEARVSQPINVNNPDSEPPTSCTFIKPLNGSNISTSTNVIFFEGTGVDNNPTGTLWKIEFTVDGLLRGIDSTPPFLYNTSLANGNHTAQVTCYDYAGNRKVGDPISFSVNGTTPPPPPPPPSDTTPPTATMTAPATGATVARRTTLALSATASDNVGVESVDFLVNGSQVCTDSTVPYSCSWKVPGAKGKRYTLSARAWDTAGNAGISPIVTVTAR